MQGDARRHSAAGDSAVDNVTHLRLQHLDLARQRDVQLVRARGNRVEIIRQGLTVMVAAGAEKPLVGKHGHRVPGLGVEGTDVERPVE